MQNVFVSPLDPYTGLPLEPSQSRKVGSNECGNPLLSDAEFGLDLVGRPLLTYTSDVGVQFVQFQGNDWKSVNIVNQKIPGSSNWQIAGEPLSRELPELQIEVITNPTLPEVYRSSNVIWLRIITDSSGMITNAKKIYKFNRYTSLKSHIHPEDPTRFIRVGRNEIYEFSDKGIDLQLIHDRFPKSPMRTWMIPGHECIDLGLQPIANLQPCPAIVFGEVNSKGKWALVVKAKNSDDRWIEVLRVPYNSFVRLNVNLISHLSPPRSVILATGDGDARLYFLNGESFVIENGMVHGRGSEMLYFSESHLLGVYYGNSTTKELLVSMVYVTQE